MDKLLNQPCQLPLRCVLGSLPAEFWRSAASRSRAAADSVPHSVGTLTVEAADLGAAPVPELQFVPFQIARTRPGGGYYSTPGRYTHYANVDSGAQVCCAYEGVLQAFPDLRCFFRDAPSTVLGVGGHATRVLGLLVDVPLVLGPAGRVDGAQVLLATFRVLSAPGYHLILGRQFLCAASGVLDLGRDELTFLAGGVRKVATVPQSTVRASHVFLEAQRRLTRAPAAPPRADAAPTPAAPASSAPPWRPAPPRPPGPGPRHALRRPPQRVP